MRPYSSAQPFFRDRSVRRRIKAYSTFASLDRGVNVGASKRKLGSRVKLTAFPADGYKGCLSYRVLWTVRSLFPGADGSFYCCPCSVLAKPCKSRTFQPLTVHTRPPFPFTFCFLPPVNSGGTVGTVFRPVGLWTNTLP